MTHIVVDCFGADHSPEAQIEGALLALAAHPDLCLTLTGDEKIIKEKLVGKTYDEGRLRLCDAPDVITCHDKPTDAIRLKRDSSMMRAVKLLREDDGIAGMVSCGSTGALVAASLLRVGRLRGVIRPAFCPILPSMREGIVGISDTGANVDITPDYLVQYALMGSVYLENVWNVENPRVALLNIGTEEEKGDDLHRKAYPLLAAAPGINFLGNMESRDLLSGKYDLVVADGFSGNVLVKSTEGACLEMLGRLKRDIMSRTLYKIGALLQTKMFRREKEFMNYQNYGGSVLLGTAKTVVKGHGSAKATSVAKCIELALTMDKTHIGDKIEDGLAAIEKARAETAATEA